MSCYKIQTTKNPVIPTKHALVMVTTWLDFGEVLLETVILANFLLKFQMCIFKIFFKVKHCLAISRNGWSDWCEIKGKALLVGYLVWYVTLIFDFTHDLDLGCFKVKFWNSCISGIVGLNNVKWKGSELIGYWANCMTFALWRHPWSFMVRVWNSLISGMGQPIDMEQKGCESSIYDHDID